MNIVWTNTAWEEYLNWQSNAKKLKKVNDLIKDIARNGMSKGIGKPELLTGEFSGFASRRIDHKNRIVYKIESGQLQIVQCGSHYKDK